MPLFDFLLCLHLVISNMVVMFTIHCRFLGAGGKLELSLSVLSPLQLFQGVHRRFAVVALQTRIDCTFDCVDEETGWTAEYMIRIDPVRFGQVMAQAPERQLFKCPVIFSYFQLSSYLMQIQRQDIIFSKTNRRHYPINDCLPCR